MYCEDCKMEVGITVTIDWLGDPEIPNGMKRIEVWKCDECGGENLREFPPQTKNIPYTIYCIQQAEAKQMADPIKDQPFARRT